MYIQRCFFSQIFTRECIYKIFSITMYVQKFFLEKKYIQKFLYMNKISKDNVFTNFKTRVYLQKYIYFSFQKCVYVSCNHYILTSFLFFLKND